MIKLNSTEVEILGKPNFACARIAQVLIESGEYEKGPSKAEYKQAVYIHWAYNLFKKHGEKWKAFGNEQINELIDKINLNRK